MNLKKLVLQFLVNINKKKLIILHPVILPELAEWKGFEGNFTVLPTSRIVYSNADLKAAAEAMAEDYELLTGKAISVVQGDQPQAGDFYFVQTTDTSNRSNGRRIYHGS